MVPLILRSLMTREIRLVFASGSKSNLHPLRLLRRLFCVCYAAKEGTVRTEDEVTKDEASEDESHFGEQGANSSTKDVRSHLQDYLIDD